MLCRRKEQVESWIVLQPISPRSRWFQVCGWTCAWKFLGSGNFGAGRKVSVPLMCSSRDLRVASALNCLVCFSQASQSSGPFRVTVVDSLKDMLGSRNFKNAVNG